MKINNLKKPLIFLLGAFLIISSCKKKTDNLILPGQLGATDVEPKSELLPLISYSIPEDSFITEGMQYKLLGIMNDPNLGISASEPYTQFTITDLNPSLNAAGNILDSAVLTIRFTSSSAFYGNLTTAQSITVHELTEDFPSTGNIASDQTLAFDNTPIGTFNGVFNLTDSTTIREGSGTTKIAPCLSITLSTAFAQRLFNAPNSTYSDDATFKQFLKGIVLKVASNPTGGEGAIVALNLDDELSKIRLYYNDSSVYNLNMQSSRSFAHYDIRTQSPSITNQHNNGGVDYDVNFLQSLTGSKVAIKLNSLSNFLSTGNKLIHKAELIVKPESGSFTSNYYLPQRLLVLQPDSFNNSIAIPDLFTGKFNGAKQADDSYVLNVTEFIQFQQNSYNQTGVFRDILHLTIPNQSPIAPSRMIIDSDKSQNEMVLRVVYSEL